MDINWFLTYAQTMNLSHRAPVPTTTQDLDDQVRLHTERRRCLLPNALLH